MSIRIRALRPPGFWRCGVFHPSDWVEHELSRFTAKQLEKLWDEPMLQIEPVKNDAPEEPMTETSAYSRNGRPPSAASGGADDKELTVEDLKNELEARGVQISAQGQEGRAVSNSIKRRSKLFEKQTTAFSGVGTGRPRDGLLHDRRRPGADRRARPDPNDRRHGFRKR